jgi:hypothetical protein
MTRWLWFFGKDTYWPASELCPPPKQSTEYTNNIRLKYSNGIIVLNPSFAKIMLTLHNQRKNAILISEHLSVMDSFQVRALAEQLKAEIVDNDSNNCKDNNQMRMNWNFHVVIGYRRLYDFLPNQYSQMFKPKWKNQWVDVENRGNFTEYFENMEKTSRHLSENMKLKFYYSLPEVTMIIGWTIDLTFFWFIMLWTDLTTKPLHATISKSDDRGRLKTFNNIVENSAFQQ